MLKMFRWLLPKRKDVIVDVRSDGERRTFQVVREVKPPKRKSASKGKRKKKKVSRKDAKRKRLKK